MVSDKILQNLKLRWQLSPCLFVFLLILRTLLLYKSRLSTANKSKIKCKVAAQRAATSRSLWRKGRATTFQISGPVTTFKTVLSVRDLHSSSFHTSHTALPHFLALCTSPRKTHLNGLSKEIYKASDVLILKGVFSLKDPEKTLLIERRIVGVHACLMWVWSLIVR